MSAMKLSQLKILLALLAAPAAGATAWPVEEPALAERVYERCHFTARGETDCTVEIRSTLLREAGRELLSTVNFTYSEQDSFEVLRAWVEQPDGRYLPLSEQQIETRTAVSPAKGIPGMKRTTLTFPQLGVGSLVQLSFRQVSAALPLLGSFHWRSFFPPSASRLDGYLAVYTAERPILWREDGMEDFRIAVEERGHKLTVELKAPRFASLPNAPAGSAARHFPRLELAGSADLQVHFGALAAHYNRLLRAPLPASAARLVRSLDGRQAAERVVGMQSYIVAKYRYLGDMQSSSPGRLPLTLSEIERNGYGDAQDLALMLAAMLRASGITAELAWVDRGGFTLPPLLPGGQGPNHMIVRAFIGQQVWWLDPADPMSGPGRIPLDIQDRWVYVAGVDGKLREESIPAAARAVFAPVITPILRVERGGQYAL